MCAANPSKYLPEALTKLVSSERLRKISGVQAEILFKLPGIRTLLLLCGCATPATKEGMFKSTLLSSSPPFFFSYPPYILRIHKCTERLKGCFDNEVISEFYLEVLDEESKRDFSQLSLYLKRQGERNI